MTCCVAWASIVSVLRQQQIAHVVVVADVVAVADVVLAELYQ